MQRLRPNTSLGDRRAAVEFNQGNRSPRPRLEPQVARLEKSKTDEIVLETQLCLNFWAWGRGLLFHRWELLLGTTLAARRNACASEWWLSKWCRNGYNVHTSKHVCENLAQTWRGLMWYESCFSGSELVLRGSQRRGAYIMLLVIHISNNIYYLLCMML